MLCACAHGAPYARVWSMRARLIGRWSRRSTWERGAFPQMLTACAGVLPGCADAVRLRARSARLRGCWCAYAHGAPYVHVRGVRASNPNGTNQPSAAADRSSLLVVEERQLQAQPRAERPGRFGNDLEQRPRLHPAVLHDLAG